MLDSTSAEHTPQAVAVVGGANMDIAGRPDHALVRRDSNPGTVRLSPGGAGRNIAHNLSLLGQDVRLVSAFGNDAHATELAAACARAGIDTSLSLTVEGGHTSTYVFIMDDRGDMELAISDMRIFEELTPAVMEERLDELNDMAACVLDTNLPAETLRFLAHNVTVPLLCDPVSTTKARRLEGILGNLHTLKPNRYEAEILSGVTIRDRQSMREAALRLLDQGLERVFISLDEGGLYCASREESLLVGTFPAVLVNATGAGDTMMAAIAWQQARGASLTSAARAGIAASSINIESPLTINEKLCASEVERRMELVKVLADEPT